MEPISPGLLAQDNTLVVYSDFTFATASPLLLRSLSADDIVLNCEVVLATAFDDAASTLSVGTPVGAEAVMSVDSIAPAYAFQYGTEDNYIAPVDETLNLYINPAASTIGSGYVLLTIRRA